MCILRTVLKTLDFLTFEGRRTFVIKLKNDIKNSVTTTKIDTV